MLPCSKPFPSSCCPQGEGPHLPPGLQVLLVSPARPLPSDHSSPVGCTLLDVPRPLAWGTVSCNLALPSVLPTSYWMTISPGLALSRTLRGSKSARRRVRTRVHGPRCVQTQETRSKQTKPDPLLLGPLSPLTHASWPKGRLTEHLLGARHCARPPGRQQ